MHFSSLAPTQLGANLCSFGALVEERLNLTQQAHPFLLQLRDQAKQTTITDQDTFLRELRKVLSQGYAVWAGAASNCL
jgi:DNA-binding IclR family transcriptional regulator